MKNIILDNEIENYVKERNIKYLVHFTRIENLSSILTNGLLPVTSLTNRRMKYVNNDVERRDNCLDANCLSILFPNYRMFFKYRDLAENANTDWVILGIKNQVLWEKDTVFCVENAASNRVSSIPLDERRGVEALKHLYDEYPGKPTRSELGIHHSIPTHPQAEIMVFDVIEPDLIWGVAFETEGKLNQYSSIIPPSVKSSVQNELYSARIDYKHWR